MKKLIIYIILQFLVLSVNSQTYNAIVINENGNKKATVLTNEIDSITFNDEGSQFVWLKDSIYKTSLSTLTSTSFEKIELPEVLVINDSIGDWSEMRIAIDGSVQMIKTKDDDSTPRELLLILPNEDIGTIYSYAIFDDKGMPKTININECVIFVDAYYDEYIDLTVAYNDTITYSVDSILVNPQRLSAKSILRSWKENNWQRNLAGIIEIACGAAGVTLGASLVTCSVVSEAGSFGASSPISIPGIIAGTVTINGGLSSIDSGWRKLYSPEENRSNLGETIYYQAAGEIISNGPQNAFVPDKYWAYLKVPNQSELLTKLGWINFFAGLSAGLVDNLYGKTITWENIRQYYQGKVITGINKDITANSAIVRGYIYPEITKSLLDGSKVVNEYGIILASSSDSNDRQKHEFINGDGGLIEHCFNNLRPSTSYNYRTYYIDKTNGISLFGDLKSFTTLTPKAYVEKANVEKITTTSVCFDYGFSNVPQNADCFIAIQPENEENFYYYPVSETEKGTYVFSELQPNTNYTYWAYIELDGISWDSNHESFTTKAQSNPSVITGDVSDITDNSANVECTFSNVPEGATCGVQYGNNGNSSIASTTSSDGERTVNLSGLQPNTTYSYQAFIQNKEEYYYGETKSFTTKAQSNPSAITGDASDITDNSANVECTFSSVPEGATCGVQYENNGNSSIASTYSSDGKRTVNLSGLQHSTTYSYRAFIQYEGEYYYGDTKSFTTKETEEPEHDTSLCPDSNHPHVIDLGLPSGTKWACCNVGATKPEEYGGYYAWGETSEKNRYSTDNYSYWDSNIWDCISLGSDISGTSYDVAHVTWDGSWVMPSYDKIIELLNYCENESTNVNGVSGTIITGHNGCKIFLPAAGFRTNEGYELSQYRGFYWSSTQHLDYSTSAYSLWPVYWSCGQGNFRGHGLSVRAVCP